MSELATVTPMVPEPTTGHLIAIALKANMTGDQITALVELKRQELRDRSAEAFAVALTKFQSQMPMVTKNRTANVNPRDNTKAGYQYQYASLDDVIYAARPHLAECGLVVSFTSKVNGPALDVTCVVRHGTHTQETTVPIPMPKMETMNTQGFGIALSYGKRYALCAALNIIVTDEDDDAASLFEKITEEQLEILQGLMKEKKVDPVLFMKWAGEMQPGLTDIKDLAQALYAKVHHGLTMKKTPTGGTKK